MKKLSWLLAIVMLFSCIGGAFAEGTGGSEGGPVGANQVMDVRASEVDQAAAAAEEERLKSDCAFSVIEADEATGQKKLSYIEGVTAILEVDGLKFKDLNKNGTLDVYEDWRADTDARIADLISQMTPEEEVGLLFCVNTQLADAAQMVREYALTCQLFNLNGTPITNNEELRAARNPYEVELTEKLQAKSAVLVKNDNNLLPLAKDAKIYLDASSAAAKEAYARYFTEKGATLVEEMEDADVVVGDFGSINDATELFIEDAQDAGKPIVLTLNCTKPTQYAIESADALLYMSYSQGADHGSTEGGFITGTAPWVYADMIFGDREPGGVINKEIARDTVADNEQ